MKTMKSEASQNAYTAPAIEVIAVDMEVGFAQSFPGGEVEPMSTENDPIEF